MRKANVYTNKKLAGVLTEIEQGKNYTFAYVKNYKGQAVSLTMPVSQKVYTFNRFPPFFEGVLPEGGRLEALLKIAKIDKNDYFKQLMVVGRHLVGAVTVERINE